MINVKDYIATERYLYPNWREKLRELYVNQSDKAYYPSRWIIGHEFGPIAIVYATCEQDAFDEVADSGKLDCMSMSDEDHVEYCHNEWFDSFDYFGNTSAPFWTNYLWIQNITKR